MLRNSVEDIGIAVLNEVLKLLGEGIKKVYIVI